MSLRIDGSSQTEAFTTKPMVNSKAEADFGKALEREQKLQNKELQAFLQKLNEKGQKLAQSLSLHDLADFRDMVKSFLRSTFGSSRRVQEDSFWDFRGRPKVLARITQIDKALEDLGQEVLNSQAKPLEILSKIDGIRGLIIDLFS